MLRGKKILLGVCGSIAAYKTAHLTRLLVKEGAEVQTIMTPSALSFIGPVTLATLSKRPALHQYIKNESGEWNNHVALGLWADVMLIAPASANTISKMAAGACDNLLLATYLSARCPVLVAPAMDLDMYAHPATQANLAKLSQYGHRIIEPEDGELASGLSGPGRLAEPENIVEQLRSWALSSGPTPTNWQGKNVLITAGPTYEALDPVRFLGNHSSGKMGYALAREAARRGATVTLVSGPAALECPENVKLINVTSAQEMYEACQAVYNDQHVIIFAAAVADYRPKQVANHKIKKKGQAISLALEKTIDIAATLAHIKGEHQLLVGFALETENEHVNAQEKLTKKNLDFIVLNSLNWSGAGFGHDTNRVSVISATNKIDFDLKSKNRIARDILDTILP